jgi:hypothetical protein
MGCGRRGGRHQARVGRTARGLIFHSVRSANDGPHRPMSALGHKRTFRIARVMSTLPPKADIDRQALFNNLISAGEVGT